MSARSSQRRSRARDRYGASSDYSCAVLRIFSNLNLHGATPPRVQPAARRAGPAKLRTTKQKKRMRIWVGLVLLATMIAIFLLGHAYT